jgi:signal transduction histidine kinase/DNA-binding response OmpR family regulator
MNARLLVISVEHETDIILARQRTRKIAALLGFDSQDQTRITTAVSEIVRNALEYAGGGRVEYRLEGASAPQSLHIIVADEGRGIADTAAILAGDHRSTTGMGIGITGARRLMDEFALESASGAGTTVRMSKALPRRAPFVAKADLGRVAGALTEQEGIDPIAEIRRQNTEMMMQLQTLQEQQAELAQLNQELQDTNRGVVALYAELADRADHLRQADELKSRFLSNMTHEFRTPLNSIMALSRLLLSRVDGELSPEQEKQVQFIRKGAENLTELVNDLLDLAKVEAGKTVVVPCEFSAVNLFSTLRGMLRPLLVGDAVALVFDPPDDVPALITDETKVSQILRNFISNAIKFTEQGEIRVWAEFDRATDSVTFRVRDTGIGIAEADLDAIWQEFAQVSHPMQRRHKGTGLGLPLSKRLAELLRGGVAVESSPGEGSVFSLTVPRVYPLRREASESEANWVIDADRIAVLSVEDDAADAFACERAVAGTRYQLIPVRSTAEASRALERFSPAVILLDVLLIGEESWRFLIETKQRKLTQDIPVIVISSTHEEHKARNLGADDFLAKPLDPERLLRALDSVTGGHSVTRVLLVDDEEVFRYLVRQLLPRGAYELREAATAQEGLRCIREQCPDVVLLDLNMPAMDGFAFIEQLRTEESAAALPAIVLSSMAISDPNRRRLAGASHIVSKSDLTGDLLVGAIRAAVGGRDARPS